MKKLLVGLLLLVSSTCFAQSSIIRGEVSPGVYVNIKADSSGNISTSPAGATTTAWTQTPVTVTNASQTFLAANASRRFLFIQNNDAAGIVYVNFSAAATTSHMKLVPGASLFVNAAVPVGTITAIGSIASNANVTIVEGQ